MGVTRLGCRCFPGAGVRGPGVRTRLLHAAAMVSLVAQPSGRPVLVMGVARSGTSWCGLSLTEGPDTVYLREPVTTALIRRPDLGMLTLESLEATADLQALGDASFRGCVRCFDRGVAVKPREWLGWTQRRVVVKEVVPLALTSIVGRYDPDVVGLVRHPAAVLASFLGRGWTSLTPRHFSRSMEPVRRLEGPVEQIGGYIGLLERRLVEQTQDLGIPDALVRYETLAAAPVREFQAIYARLGLAWDDRVQAAVAERASGQLRGRGINDTNKVSATRVDRWRSQLTLDQRTRVQRGYRALGGSLYQDW